MMKRLPKENIEQFIKRFSRENQPIVEETKAKKYHLTKREKRMLKERQAHLQTVDTAVSLSKTSTTIP